MTTLCCNETVTTLETRGGREETSGCESTCYRREKLEPAASNDYLFRVNFYLRAGNQLVLKSLSRADATKSESSKLTNVGHFGVGLVSLVSVAHLNVQTGFVL